MELAARGEGRLCQAGGFGKRLAFEYEYGGRVRVVEVSLECLTTCGDELVGVADYYGAVVG